MNVIKMTKKIKIPDTDLNEMEKMRKRVLAERAAYPESYKKWIRRRTMEKQKELMKSIDKNREYKPGLDFVRFWANYVKKTPVNIWSSKQKELVDSLLAEMQEREDLRLHLMGQKR